MNLAARKRLGAYYTPDEVARLIVEWSMSDGHGPVLDPSCGDGAFLRAAVSLMRDQAEFDAVPIRGIDVNATAAANVQRQSIIPASDVVNADFLSLTLADTGWEPFGAVVGNPPYIRHQQIEDTALYARIANSAGCQLSRRAGLWAYFVVHSATWLRPDGRLSLLVPEAIVQTDYGVELLAWLRNRFQEVLLVPLGQRIFDGTDERALALFARGQGPGTVSLARSSGLGEVELVARGQQPTQGWTHDLAGHPGSISRLDDDAERLVATALTSGRFRDLGSLFDIHIGLVTGSNRHFILDADAASQYGLADEQLASVVARSKWLKGLSFDAQEHKELLRAGERALVVAIDSGSQPSNAWFVEGETNGAASSSHAKRRRQWWSLDLGAGADAFASVCNHGSPRIVANPSGIACTNAVHALHLRALPEGLQMRDIAAAFLNSVTALHCEVHGRRYGGGVLKTEPSTLRNAPVPIHAFSESELAQIDALLRNGCVAAARERVDEIVLVGEVGLSSSQVTRVRELLADAVRERHGGTNDG